MIYGLSNHDPLWYISRLTQPTMACVCVCVLSRLLMRRPDHACCLGHVDTVLVDGVVCAGIGYLCTVSLSVGHSRAWATHSQRTLSCSFLLMWHTHDFYNQRRALEIPIAHNFHPDLSLITSPPPSPSRVYCGPSFAAGGWNIWTRKSTYCDQHFTPDGCVKCRVAVHPNMNFGSVTQKDLQKRFPPY